jgi:hypothetical protein
MKSKLNDMWIFGRIIYYNLRLMIMTFLSIIKFSFSANVIGLNVVIIILWE